jgi:hypothetical protein
VPRTLNAPSADALVEKTEPQRARAIARIIVLRKLNFLFILISRRVNGRARHDKARTVPAAAMGAESASWDRCLLAWLSTMRGPRLTI